MSRFARMRQKTQVRLEHHTNNVTNFYTLTGLAAALAGLGLLLDNTAIIIGAMVLAPLIIPIISFSLAFLAFEIKRFFRALLHVILGSFFTVIIAYLLGTIAIIIEGQSIKITTEMFLRTDPNLLYFLVALFSGLAGAYSYARPKVLESLTGIAIAVAIVPPLAVSGLQLANGELAFAMSSLTLFFFNFAGICFGSILMFFILGFAKDIKK